MTKTEIELLMTRDVDEISEVGIHHSQKQLSITLKNAATLLARERHKDAFEEHLFVFKLLRFLQAALAGAHAHVTGRLAHEIVTSVEVTLKRNSRPELQRIAQSVLSLLMVKTSAPATIKRIVVTVPGMGGLVHQASQSKPSGYGVSKGLKPALPRSTSPRSEITRPKVAPKPKGLAR
jgi:hypothetical protein